MTKQNIPEHLLLLRNENWTKYLLQITLSQISLLRIPQNPRPWSTAIPIHYGMPCMWTINIYIYIYIHKTPYLWLQNAHLSCKPLLYVLFTKHNHNSHLIIFMFHVLWAATWTNYCICYICKVSNKNPNLTLSWLEKHISHNDEPTKDGTIHSISNI